MLKAALYLAGDRRYEKDLKAVDASPIADERINSWSFYSDRRRRGLHARRRSSICSATIRRARCSRTRVAEGLVGQTSYYYNTQELVWGVTGLGKWVNGARRQGHGRRHADRRRRDDRRRARRKHKTNDKTWSLARASEYKSLTLDVPAVGRGHVARDQQRGRAAGRRLQGRRQRPDGHAHVPRRSTAPRSISASGRAQARRPRVRRDRGREHERRDDPEHRARRSAARRLRDREPAARPQRPRPTGSKRRGAVGDRLHEHARRSPRGVRHARGRTRRRRSSTRCAR